MPNMVYMSPTNKEEYLAILDWSVNQTEYPVAIRVPFQGVTSTGEKDTTDYSIINTNYNIGNGVVASVSVLGPERMDYAKIASALKYISDELDKYNKE